MDRGVWQGEVLRASQSRTQLKQLSVHRHKPNFVPVLLLASVQAQWQGIFDTWIVSKHWVNIGNIDFLTLFALDMHMSPLWVPKLMKIWTAEAHLLYNTLNLQGHNTASLEICFSWPQFFIKKLAAKLRRSFFLTGKKKKRLLFVVVQW